MGKEYLYLITLILSISLISALPNDASNSINFNYQTTINYSLVNVNNSDYLDGHDSSYFYPASNPDSYIDDGNTLWDNIYGFITNTVSDLSNYFTKTESDARYMQRNGTNAETIVNMNTSSLLANNITSTLVNNVDFRNVTVNGNSITWEIII